MVDGLEQAPFKGMKKGETTKANPGIFASFMGELKITTQPESKLALVARELKRTGGLN